MKQCCGKLMVSIAIAVALSACGGENFTSPQSKSVMQGPPGSDVVAPEGYHLVWSDEFSVDGMPDTSKWGYDTYANSTGWYNNEKQYYAANRWENSRIEGGKLIIEARKEALTSMSDYGGQQYTSARLHTRDTSTWTYGFYEIRAKLPCGLGTWPAIWTLGTVGAHPANGEIDIMEQVGKTPNKIEGTIYTAETGAELGGHTESIEVEDPCNNFHDYQLTWTPEKLIIAVDGVAYNTYENPGTASGWPFDNPQYMLLNLAIGGDMTGDIDDNIFNSSVRFEIEYVRVFQKD